MEECTEDNIYTDLLRIHEGSSWMYFKSKPLCEIKLYEALKAQNVICYLPLVKKTTEYQHRIYTRMVPMFGGGYVFASTSRNGFDLARINRNLFILRTLNSTVARSPLFLPAVRGSAVPIFYFRNGEKSTAFTLPEQQMTGMIASHGLYYIRNP